MDQSPYSASAALGDGRALPLPDDSFDVVSACYVLHLLAVQDRRRVLEEIRRVVRPGGRVVIVTVDAARRDLRWVLSMLPSWTTLHRVDAAAELTAAGLHVVETRYARTGWPSLCLLAQRELGDGGRCLCARRLLLSPVWSSWTRR
jgi:SAM-dependent methyltransferase